MTPQELKNSILQLAIQGKLVEQRPEEGTAEELFQKIQEEKQRLITEKKIKKEKPLPEITEDEKPFDIPESWKWVRLSKIITLLSGKDMTTAEYNEQGNGIPYITGASNISEVGLIINRWIECPKAVAHMGDILLTCKGTVGKTLVLKEKSVHVARQIMAITTYSVEVYFIKYFLDSQIKHLKSQAKSMIPGIERNNVLLLPIPLPPLEEQKRIVAKIEELLPYIDRYEKAWNKLEQFNKRFPEDMKKSLLQYAIEGKLVEQRPEEGTAEELFQKIKEEKQRLIREKKIKKEKPLPEITEEEKPFDIPEGWKWVRLGNIGTTQTGNTPSKAHPEYIGNAIPFITPGDIMNGDINYENQSLSMLGMGVARICEVDSILQVCIGGSIGKAAQIKRRITFNQQINAISPIMCNSKYIYYVITSHFFTKSMKEKAGGTATPIINRGIWDTLLLPLPPLDEQKRIVEKLEQLLPLCDRLM